VYLQGILSVRWDEPFYVQDFILFYMPNIDKQNEI
jgi:hypothetical protein